MVTTEAVAPSDSEIIRKLRSIAIHSLARMYRPEEQLFAFRLRKNGEREVVEGVSRRYTAVALIGLAGEDHHTVAEILRKHRREDICGQLLDQIEESQDLGEIALTTWAARTFRHPRTQSAVEKLKRMNPASNRYPTVERAWALMALTISGSKSTDVALAERIADTLMGSFREDSGLFPHAPAKKGLSALRAHVSCFADLVYPIQALSHYHQTTGSIRAADIACRCAERMCQLQGPAGQWWWHFDARTGRLIERYPVYAVHQDSMAPMALFALAQACNRNHWISIKKGLSWLTSPTEKISSLIDEERRIIWRKVGRREPRRFARSWQAAGSLVHPAVRIPGLDILFPPDRVDYETRPYHMGWILHAWPGNSKTKPVQTSLRDNIHPVKS